MLNLCENNNQINRTVIKKRLAKKSKFKIKWKMIQWIIDNKKKVVEQLSGFQNNFLTKKLKNGFEMNQNQFREMMSCVGMGGDQLLIERLFYVLENNEHNKVDY